MSSRESLVGRSLGAYRIEDTLGTGATGTVYRASRDGFDQPVALKILHDREGKIGRVEQRFAREARVLQKLSHPHIVQIFDYGMEEGRTYIAMELLDGETLEERLERGTLKPPEIRAILDPVLDALGAAHEREIVHRDLKPANVFLLADGGVKLLDFGLAKMLSTEDAAVDADTLTRRGRIVGTPAYMAPEQITGVFIDVRADVYAMGVMLYELLADRRPFMNERRSELLRAHLLAPVPDVESCRAGLRVDPALRELLQRALHKDVEARYATGWAMRDALRELPECYAWFERTARATPAPRAQRTAATSEIISTSETRAVSDSAGVGLGSSAPQPATPKAELANRASGPPSAPSKEVGREPSPRTVVALLLGLIALALVIVLLLVARSG